MTQIKIEYCVPCGLLSQALEVQQVVLDEFGQDVETAQLTTGDGGVFKVFADDEIIWDRSTYGVELDPDLVVGAIRERVEANT